MSKEEQAKIREIKKMAKRPLVMPGQVAQEEVGGSGFQPCVVVTEQLSAGQIAQQRLLDNLIANLPE